MIYAKSTPAKKTRVRHGGWGGSNNDPSPPIDLGNEQCNLHGVNYCMAHYRCIFDGYYAFTMKALIIHFNQEHGRVV